MKMVIDDNSTNIKMHDLTPMQHSYYIGSQNDIKWGGVDCQGYLEIALEDCDTDKFLNSWEILVSRHEMLRASIFNGRCIINGCDYVDNIEVIDLSDSTDRDIKNRLSMIREELKNTDYKVFNKSFKGILVKTKKCSALHLSINLLFVDFGSVQILFKELKALLSGELLDEKQGDFFDYLDLVGKYSDNRISEDKKYWNDRINNFPSYPKLPRSGRLSPKTSIGNEFKRYTFYLNSSCLESLKRKSIKYGLTLSSVILSAYSYVISLWSENKKFLLNIPIQNRLPVLDSKNIVGEFTDVNILEVDFEQTKSFLQYSRSIFEQLMDDLDHRNYSGIDVISDLKKLTNNTDFISPFVFTGVLQNDSRSLHIKYGITKTPQVWVDCQIVEDVSGLNPDRALSINWDVREGIFDDNLIDIMFLRFERFLTEAAGDSFLWENNLEKNIISLEKFYNNHKDISIKGRIQDRFIEQAIKHPDRIAVVYRGKEYTYQKLYYDALKVSDYIINNCVSDEVPYIGLKIDKNYNQIVGILGILMSGFSYLPIDISQPYERQLKILNKAKVNFVLDEDRINEVLKKYSSFDIVENKYMSDIAYVIFTSGTTGTPKGVVMTHNAVLNTLDAINNLIKLTSNDRILAISEASFDLSVFNIFSLLGVGGMIVIPDSDRKNDPSHWNELIKRYEITLWNSVPAQAELLEHFCRERDVFPSLRFSLLSGDVIKVKLPEKLIKIFPNSKIFSLGGATEGGIWSIYHEINPKVRELPSILYGKPLYGQSVVIIDKHLNECEIYSVGQIAIAGYSLAEGYLNDETITKEKFIYDSERNWRYYLTGDLGRYQKNGEIEFIGRMDNQIKINGYRIEISEIESELLKSNTVENCFVLKIDNKIIAFIIEKNSIKKYLDAYKINYDDKNINLEYFNRCLTDAILKSVYDNLKNHEIFSVKLEKYWSIVNKTGVTKENQPILDRMLLYLEKHDYIKKIEDAFVDRNKIVSNDLWNQLCKDYSIVAPKSVTNYIKKHAENFCELLSGKMNPLVNLFPGGNTDIAEILYKQTIISKYINNIISDVVYLHLKDTSCANILEVGGGIGATTDFILSKFAENEYTHYKYLFTDVSAFFLNNIKQKYPYINTGIFDLNNADDKINSNKFDVIVAVGVLNNVVNIDNSLSILNEMLSDSGIIIIADPVGEHIEIDISQAFMMPNHTDKRAKSGNIFFSEEEWEESIKSCNLDLILSIPDKNSNNFYSNFGQKIFVMRKNDNRKQTYKEFLADKLPQYMIPSEFIYVDMLPLTQNGKIDRKRLIDIYMKTQDSSFKHGFGNENKSNDAERKSKGNHMFKSLLKIYMEIGEVDSLTEKDNLRDIGFDSLLLSQAAGKIINLYGDTYDIKFDELLKISLSECNLQDIYNYILDKKIKSHNTSDSFSSAIVKIYKDVGAIQSLNLDDDLRKLGFDSLMLSQAAGKIMELYAEEYDIKFDELLRVSLSDGTIDKIILYIKNAKRGKNFNQNNTEENYNNENFKTSGVVIFGDINCESYFEIVEKLKLTKFDFKKVKTFKHLVELDDCKEKVILTFDNEFNKILNFASQKIIDGKAFKKIVAISPNLDNIYEPYLGRMVIYHKKRIEFIDRNPNFIDCDYKFYDNTEQLLNLIMEEIDE